MKNILWMVVSYLTVITLLVTSCAPTVTEDKTEEQMLVMPGEEETVPEEETVTEEEASTLPSKPVLITKDASQMVLVITDFEAGWVRQSAKSSVKENAQSAYHVYFYDGSLLPLSPPVIQNTISVYPSIELAQQVYLDTVPKNVSVENPQVGDECFLDISISVNKRLVFRKSNVVVWLWLQQDMFGDIKPYARMIEKKLVSTLNELTD